MVLPPEPITPVSKSARAAVLYSFQGTLLFCCLVVPFVLRALQ